MDSPFTFLPDLAREAPPPDDGILSRTVYQDAQIKAVVFGLAAGHELSEHTAAFPAILQIIQGEATITLGAESRQASAGAWVHMPARLPHSIKAESPTIMLLLLLKS
jgi:quercetin dioxygenase-like cupin family protein